MSETDQVSIDRRCVTGPPCDVHPASLWKLSHIESRGHIWGTEASIDAPDRMAAGAMVAGQFQPWFTAPIPATCDRHVPEELCGEPDGRVSPFFVVQQHIVMNPRIRVRDYLRVIPLDIIRSATLYDHGAFLEIVFEPASPYKAPSMGIQSPLRAAERRRADRAYQLGTPETLNEPMPDYVRIAHQEFLGECRKLIDAISARATEQRTTQ